MAEYCLLDPVDVLYLRGNRLFGDAGAHGEALMPPWPSLAAGSLRSRMLIDHGHNPKAYGTGEIVLSGRLGAVLGTPAHPGTFRISLFTLGKFAGEEVEPCFPLPADLVARDQHHALKVSYLRPVKQDFPVQCGYPFEQLPVLETGEPFKPEENLWLNSKGLASYLAGAPITDEHLVRRCQLWQLDTRLGIGLDESSHTAAAGRIYTAETIALSQGVAFLVGIQGADGSVPNDGLLRFGGDGRSVRVKTCRPNLVESPWSRIQQEGRFRIVLATPGIFSGGWAPPGCKVDSGKWSMQGPGFRARLVAASVPRHAVVSGWDIARQKPKTALRVAPTGSVYWFDQMEGRFEGLQQLVHDGLWPDMEECDPVRRAEGFNNIVAATWAPNVN